MKLQTQNQEILLFTNTSFSKRELCENDDRTGSEPKQSLAEQLEKACWSGLLFEILTGTINNNLRTNFIWKVVQAEEFFRIETGTSPLSYEIHTSIDPYFFLDSWIHDN